MEIWKNVRGFEDFYDVSNYGRVRSHYKYIACWFWNPRYKKTQKIWRSYYSKILKHFIVNGYPTVNLCKNFKQYSVQYVHKLVLEAFICGRPDNMECCHYDGNKLNNKLDNLRWGTKYDNIVTDETRLKGKMSTQKLTAKKVYDIKSRLYHGEKIKDIALCYNISIYAIRDIKVEKCWKFVKWPNELYKRNK